MLKTEKISRRIIEAWCDFKVFCETCFRDDITGKLWKLADHHKEWADLIAKPIDPKKFRKQLELDELIANRRIVIWAPTETGKSSIISMAYPIWLLGHNPNLRIIIVSNTVEQVEKFTLKIGQEILTNPMIHAVFPKLRPQKSAISPAKPQKWTSRHLMVERTLKSKDYSITGYGVGGAVLNARADVIIMDDVLDLEIARSPAQRAYIVEWTESTLIPRLRKGGQLIAIGVAWHSQDVMHALASKNTFVHVKYSLWEEDAKDGYRIINWPDVYPKERIQQDLEDLGFREFARQKRCRPMQAENLTFPGFESCLVKVDSWKPPETQLVVSMGVDIGTSARPGTAIAVVGMDTETRHRYLLDMQFGKWSGPDEIKAIVSVYEKWESLGLTPSYVVVENNAVQQALIDFLSEPNIGRPDMPIMPFTTGKNKADPNIGLPSLALEFERGIWSIPQFPHYASCSCNWCRLLREFREHPNGATSDGVMAVWFAREGIRGLVGRRKRLRRVSRPTDILKWVKFEKEEDERKSEIDEINALIEWVNSDSDKPEIKEDELRRMLYDLGLPNLDELKEFVRRGYLTNVS